MGRDELPPELRALRDKLAGRYPMKVWEKPPRVALELPPEDWDGVNLHAEHEPIAQAVKTLDPLWWMDLREMALAGEVR